MTDRDNKELQKLISHQMVRSFWESYALKHNVKNNRERHNIIHKHAFFHIIRTNTSLSLAKIGGIMGKDHATVLHAYRNHETNYRFDADYRLTYDNMSVEIEDFLVENGVIPKGIHPTTSEISDVHFKLIDVSRRLREKIKEFDSYKQKVSLDLRRVEAIKKHNKELSERNEILNSELKRVKNLI